MEDTAYAPVDTRFLRVSDGEGQATFVPEVILDIDHGKEQCHQRHADLDPADKVDHAKHGEESRDKGHVDQQGHDQKDQSHEEHLASRTGVEGEGQ